MNRHHFALFVRHCRLILLLRKNFNDGDLNIFLPAEWRWKIPQVCDNEWHQYTIIVDLPKVELFVDGAKFAPAQEDRHNNPEIIDDWPLHAAQGINTTLTVGACYQSSENRLKHGFRGDISSIKLGIDKIIQEDEVVCGMNCAERLITPDEKLIGIGQEIQINNQMNEITVEGTSKQNIEQLLQGLQYINDKRNPTIGRRNIVITSTVSCPMKKAVKLPAIDTFIMITDASRPTNTSESSKTNMDSQDLKSSEFKPQIIISGNQNNLVSYPDIKNGVRFLNNIDIAIYSNDNIQERLQNLDSCSVNVFPNLNSDHEEITFNHTETKVSKEFDIKTNINKDGVEMIGYDSIKNYLRILRSLVYINRKPAYYLNRVFKLSCSQLGDQFHSAESTLTLTVLHPKQAVAAKAPLTTDKPIVSVQNHDNSNLFNRVMFHQQEIAEPYARTTHNVHSTNATHSTLLIVVICVSFVLLICGVGIARLRNQTQVVKGKDRNQQLQKVSKLNVCNYSLTFLYFL